MQEDKTVTNLIRKLAVGVAASMGMMGAAHAVYVDGNPLMYADPRGLTKVNMFSPQDMAQYNGAVTDPDDPNTCLVYAHGNTQNIADESNGISNAFRYVVPGSSWLGHPNTGSASDFAAFLIHHGCKPSQPVVLKACLTGSGPNSFAQQFSQQWPASVAGPTQEVWYKGTNGINPVPYPAQTANPSLPDYSNPGTYNWFNGGQAVGN